jgi:hypothetical protein
MAPLDLYGVALSYCAYLSGNPPDSVHTLDGIDKRVVAFLDITVATSAQLIDSSKDPLDSITDVVRDLRALGMESGLDTSELYKKYTRASPETRNLFGVLFHMAGLREWC